MSAERYEAVIMFNNFSHYLELCSNNSNKAILLNRIFFYHSISKYYQDGKKYFTRSLSILAAESGLSLSTIKKYIKEFKDKKLIETWCKLFGNKKQVRFSITQKALSLSSNKSPHSSSIYPLKEPENTLSTIYKKSNNKKKDLLSNTSNTENSEELKNCVAQNNDFDLINDLELSKPSTEELADSYAEYEQQPQTKEKFKSGKSNQPQAPKHSVRSPKKLVEQQITETLTKTQKKYVKAVTINLSAQIEITKPEKLTKEIEQAIINPKRFSKSKTFKHKVNAIAKCIREGHWHAPASAVEGEASSPHAFKAVHISQDDDGHNLIEVEQPQTTQPKFSPQDQLLQDQMNKMFEESMAKHLKL